MLKQLLQRELKRKRVQITQKDLDLVQVGLEEVVSGKRFEDVVYEHVEEKEPVGGDGKKDIAEHSLQALGLVLALADVNYLLLRLGGHVAQSVLHKIVADVVYFYSF